MHHATGVDLGLMRALVRSILVGVASILGLACGELLPSSSEASTVTDETPPSATTHGAPIDTATPGAEDGGAPDASAPDRDRIVFVTSRTYLSAAFASADAADAECEARASEASPALAGRPFVAWLSDAWSTPVERLGARGGPWARVDGVRVADDVDHLVGGANLRAAIDVDELGARAEGRVWTGTDGEGDAAKTCGYWMTSQADATVGALVADAPEWTDDGTEKCALGRSGDDEAAAVRNRIYCFEREP